jgi:Notch-like protein
MFLAEGKSPAQIACSQSLCQNGGTCQDQGLTATCVCKPGYNGQRCESGRLNK